MDYLIEVYDNLWSQYDQFISQESPWVTAVYIILLVAGFFVAAANEKKHNFIVWVVPVITLPVIGTIIAIIAAVILKVKKINVDYLPLRVHLLLFPFAAFMISAIFGKEILDKNIYNEAIPLTMAFAVLLVMFLYHYRKATSEPLYFRLAKKNVNAFNRKKHLVTYSYIHEASEAIPKQRELPDVVNSAAQKYLSGADERRRVGWSYTDSDKDYNYEVFTEDEYRERFDVTNTKYMGHDIMMITALDWEYNEDKGIILREGHFVPPEKRYPEKYQHYSQGLYVQEVVLFRWIKPYLDEALKCAEVMFLFLLFLTPVGAEIHSTVLSLISDIIALF